MFAIPVVIVEIDGSLTFHDGTLIRLSPDLGGIGKIKNYGQLSRPGWHRIDFNYAAYVIYNHIGVRYVFVGLNVKEIRPTRKLFVPNFYSRADIELFCQREMERDVFHYNQAKSDLGLLVHDLRRLSASIYHAAIEARAYADQGDLGRTRVRIENCIAAQGMLTLRTDALDLMDSTEDLSVKELVQVYKKVDKVVRCFKPLSERKNIHLDIDGESYSSSLGPNVFEIVPYVIIDNAKKYSPHYGSVEVKVADDHSNIHVTISSLGPHIASDEMERIYQKGFRGLVAQERDTNGSGVGLFLAKQIINHFHGHISTTVSEFAVETSVGPCHEISFAVCVPQNVSDVEREEDS